MRVLVLRHDQFPHATAVPLALTGARLGDPTLAGSGAAIERFFRERDGGTRPRAAVVHPGDLSRFDNVQSALAVGLHPGAARPLELPLARLPDLLDLLARPATASHGPAHDAAVAGYTRRLDARLRRPDGAPLRAAEALASTPRSTPAAATPPPSPSCSALPRRPRRRMRRAGPLDPRLGRPRGHPTCSPARTPPATPSGSTPACAPPRTAATTPTAITCSPPPAMTRTSRPSPDEINRPDEHDPDKLDLADTLIVITSEFGRSPTREDDRTGSATGPGPTSPS